MAEARVEQLIQIRLQLFADLRRFLPRGSQAPLEVSLPAGSMVRQLLEQAGIPLNEEITIGLNGEQGFPNSLLRDGDEVVLFSPMEGG